MGVRRVTLGNGVKCLFIREPKSRGAMPTATFSLIVGTGARDDPAGKSGLAHVVEHVVARSLPELRDRLPKSLAEADERRRLILPRAQTTLDYTSFGLQVPTETFADGFRFLAWQLESAAELCPLRMASARDEVVAEKRGHFRVNPFARVWDQLYRSAYPGHPYGRYSVGRFADLRKIEPRDCTRFLARGYGPGNVWLACRVRGEDSPELGELVEAAEVHFGAIPKRPTPAPKLPVPVKIPPRFRSRTVDRCGLPSCAAIGVRLDIGGEELASFQVANYLLIGSRSGLRKDMGQKASLLAATIPLTREPGLYELLAVASRPRGARLFASELAERFFNQAERLRKRRPSEAHFAWAKDQAARSHHRSIADGFRHVENANLYEFIGSGAERWLAEAERIGGVRWRSVSDSIEKLGRRDRATLVVSV